VQRYVICFNHATLLTEK